MLTKYIQAAMQRAHYEILETTGRFTDQFQTCRGSGRTRRRSKLAAIPPLDGIELLVKEVA